MLKTRPLVAAHLVGLVALLAVAAHTPVGAGWARSKEESLQPITRPLPADHRVNKDGSITLRVCFNWSCARREPLTFTTADLAAVKTYLAQCRGESFYDRVQRLRVGVWQLQLIAQKYLPQLANDREINEFDRDVPGRLDCVDSSTNTTTYLKILQDLGELPGWSVAAAEVRNILDLHGVHWTAVAIDTKTGARWSVDSWFRPHGHLPFVMPLAEWIKERKAWEPPFDKQNPYPESIQELCPAPRTAASESSPEAETVATRGR